MENEQKMPPPRATEAPVSSPAPSPSPMADETAKAHAVASHHGHLLLFVAAITLVGIAAFISLASIEKHRLDPINGRLPAASEIGNNVAPPLPVLSSDASWYEVDPNNLEPRMYYEGPKGQSKDIILSSGKAWEIDIPMDKPSWDSIQVFRDYYRTELSDEWKSGADSQGAIVHTQDGDIEFFPSVSDGGQGGSYGYVRIADSQLQYLWLATHFDSGCEETEDGPCDPVCPCTVSLKVFLSDQVSVESLVSETWNVYHHYDGFKFLYPEGYGVEHYLMRFNTFSANGVKLLRNEDIAKQNAGAECYYGQSGLPSACSVAGDPGIAFAVITPAYEDTLRRISWTGHPVTISGMEGTRFQLGAEGEGIDYYVFPFTGRRTLVIEDKYINRRNTSTNPPIFPEALSKQIIETFTKDENPISVVFGEDGFATYRNNRFGYTLSYDKDERSYHEEYKVFFSESFEGYARALYPVMHCGSDYGFTNPVRPTRAELGSVIIEGETAGIELYTAGFPFGSDEVLDLVDHAVVRHCPAAWSEQPADQWSRNVCIDFYIHGNEITRKVEITDEIKAVLESFRSFEPEFLYQRIGDVCGRG